MAEHVEIQMDGLKKRLGTLRKRLKNSEPAMQKIAIVMYKDVQDHFDKESSNKGKWAPIKYRTGKILQDTGNLKKSVEASNTKTSATVSSEAFSKKGYNYAPIQNHFRKFMWISKGIRENITKILGKFFIGN